MLKKQPEEEPMFNYNSIDKLSYRELKIILENLRAIRNFNFEYASDNETPEIEQNQKRILHLVPKSKEDK